MQSNFRVGDRVVFTMNKRSSSPGPRASNVKAAPTGELYSYQVEKYWVVAELLDGDRLRLLTRRGKSHIVDADDVRLRKARWWERWFSRSRFPDVAEQSSDNASEISGYDSKS